MASTEQRNTGSMEVALLIGVLMIVAAGTVATYWVRSRAAEASAPKTAVTAAAPTPTTVRAAVPAPAAGDVVHDDIYFDFKSTRLRADAVRLLQERAALMDRGHTWVVIVHGYADRHGPAEYNRQLAQRRAEAVKQFLVELGVPDTAVKAVAVGQDATLCDEPDKACQQLNRRVHLEIRKLGPVAVAPVRPVLTERDVLQSEASAAAALGQ